MLIVSKFRDYYDSGLAYGVDKKVVYARNQEVNYDMDYIGKVYETLAGASRWRGPYSRVRSFSFTGSNPYRLTSVTEGILGFCGKLYSVYRVVFLHKPEEFWVTPKQFPLHEFEPKGLFNRRYRDRSAEALIGSLFLKKENLEIFEKLGVPVFLWEVDRVTLNPNLSELRFGKVIPPEMAFQELSMWLSKEKEVPNNTPDKYLALSKGFDKHSFRKRPK